MSLAGFRTVLRLSDGDLGLEELAVGVSLERTLGRLTVQGAGAAVLTGTARPAGAAELRLGPGGSASGAVSYAALLQDGAVPFLVVGGSLSGSGVASPVGALVALDLRVSVLAGYTLFERLTLYAAGRVFGGPAFFRAASGGDASHYQVGGGALVRLPGAVDLSVEVMPLGEQRLVAALGFSF